VQQNAGKEVVFRVNVAFAKPEINEALEEPSVKYASAFRPTTAWSGKSQSC